MADSSGVLGGQTIIVTGAGSGIGRSSAVMAAAAGATVIVTDIKGQDDTAAAIGASAEAHALDVTDFAQWTSVVEDVRARHGSVSGLVNNAGIATDSDSLETQTEEGWQQLIDVDLKGVWLGMRAVLGPMREQGGGAIVNIASVAGLLGAPDTLTYSAAKGGVIAMTRQVAIQYASHKLRVNAVCPGVTETAILDGIPDDLRAALAGVAPLGRLGQPEDIGGLVTYLLSPASAYITGQAIAIDGGWTAQ